MHGPESGTDNPREPRPMEGKRCLIEGCEKPTANGPPCILCGEHLDLFFDDDAGVLEEVERILERGEDDGI